MKISIVTPSYNQPAYLKLCIASVADQKGVIVEHIVQDSCSDDGTLKWLPKDSRVKAFIEKDNGMYDAINRGLKRATGEICAYLNCDEQYLPETLATVADFFEAHPDVDVLFGDVVLIDQNGTPLSYRRSILPTKSHLRLGHLNTPTCATFFRKSLLDRGFYFDPEWKAIGDAVRMQALLNAKVPMATLHTPLAVFAFTGENLGATDLSKKEALRWKGANTALTSVMQVFVIVTHRLRKLLAGAYKVRTIQVSIYTPDLPEARRRFISKVGFSWPE